MPEYLRPGVYSERVDASAPGITAIRTDVAAFVGIAQSGPLHRPVPVQSFRQFQAHFGDFTGQAYLAYAVRGFFENGGRRCWVVRVASRTEGRGAASASLDVGDGSQPVWRISAANPGVWGDDLAIALQQQRDAQTTLDPVASCAQFAQVGSVTGFCRGTLVRLSQGNGVVTTQWRVVSTVDAVTGRLYWQHPQPGAGLPYDRALSGFEPNTAVTLEAVNYRLLVYRSGRLLANYADLSVVPEHPNYAPRQLAPAEYPTRLQAGQGLPASPPPIVIEELRSNLSAIPTGLVVDGGRQALGGGRDGLAALSTADFIGEAVSPLDSDTLKAHKMRGIEALNLVDEIATVALPDIVIRPQPDPVYQAEPAPQPNPCLRCPPPPEPRQAFSPRPSAQELPPAFNDAQIYQVQAALVQHCEQRGDRFAVLDPPFSAAQNDQLGVGAIRAWRARFDSSYAALYYPWLKVSEPLGTALVRQIPPSGHILGQYAAHDLEIGVHKAAANRPLVWAKDLSIAVGDGQHEILNPLGINAVRDALGRGLRIMGGRTLSSDPDWRYVNVRRLLLMIRKAVDLSSQWAVFEPNAIVTWHKLTVALTSFLTALWQQGALVGATAEQAFFIKCDEETNPPEQRNNGRLLALVGVAPSKPYEFVLLRVGRQGNELEISEAGIGLHASSRRTGT